MAASPGRVTVLYVCPLEGDGCDRVVEVEYTGLPVASPACPDHDVTMLLGGYRAVKPEPTADDDPLTFVYDEVVPRALELLERLKPWSAHGVQSEAATLTLAITRLPDREEAPD